MENTLLGLVLCGGKSSRMGTDKGQLLKGGCTWAAHMSTRLESLGLKTYLSVNSGQQEGYSRIFSAGVLIPDRVDVKGPLAGLLSAHQRFPESDIFVLPCDMIDVEAPVLQRLLEIRRHIVHADVYCYVKNNHAEPLCAIYTTSGLQKLFADYQDGCLTNFSLQNAIKSLRAVKLPIADHAREFRNYNTPACVRRWQRTEIFNLNKLTRL